MGEKSFPGDCKSFYRVIQQMHRPKQAEALGRALGRDSEADKVATELATVRLGNFRAKTTLGLTKEVARLDDHRRAETTKSEPVYLL